MAHVSIQSTTSIGITERIGTLFQGLRKAWNDRAMYNRTYNELSSLSDRELDDLGLHRSNIRQVALEGAKRI